MGRCPIVPGPGCTQGFSVTLVAMGVSGMCENMCVGGCRLRAQREEDNGKLI